MVTPPPTVIGRQLFFKGSDIGTRRNDEILEKTQCSTNLVWLIYQSFSLWKLNTFQWNFFYCTIHLLKGALKLVNCKIYIGINASTGKNFLQQTLKKQSFLDKGILIIFALNRRMSYFRRCRIAGYAIFCCIDFIIVSCGIAKQRNLEFESHQNSDRSCQISLCNHICHTWWW